MFYENPLVIWNIHKITEILQRSRTGWLRQGQHVLWTPKVDSLIAGNVPTSRIDGDNFPSVVAEIEKLAAADSNLVHIKAFDLPGQEKKLVISTEGIVSLARILNSTTDDVLDEAALAAVRQWVFEPGSLHGELVPVRAIVTINFRVY
mgnify:CR=1 FL=1